MTEVRVSEDLGLGDDEGVLSAWLYATGDTVEEGAVIAQVMLEKAQMDLVAPASGVLTIVVPDEGAIKTGQVIAHIK